MIVELITPGLAGVAGMLLHDAIRARLHRAPEREWREWIDNQGNEWDGARWLTRTSVIVRAADFTKRPTDPNVGRVKKRVFNSSTNRYDDVDA